MGRRGAMEAVHYARMILVELSDDDLIDLCNDVLSHRPPSVRGRIAPKSALWGRTMTVEELALGDWMSAALDDDKVCAEMKADIRTWMGMFQ